MAQRRRQMARPRRHQKRVSSTQSWRLGRGFNFRVSLASKNTRGQATMDRSVCANNRAAYDEDDDGFQFTRRTSRRTTKAQPHPEPIPEEPLKSIPTRRKRPAAAVAPPPLVEQTVPEKRRRSARLSGDQKHIKQVDGAGEREEPPKSAPRRTKKTTHAPGEQERKKQITPVPEAQPRGRSAAVGAQTPTHNELHVSKKRDGGATKIMLPFADTPVINRNKEMRKASKEGHRRSSTGLRGRRASSLIDSGMSNGKQSRSSVLRLLETRKNKHC